MKSYFLIPCTTNTWSETFANTSDFNEFFVIELEKPFVNHLQLCKCPCKVYQHIHIFKDNDHICVLYYGVKNQAGYQPPHDYIHAQK